MEYFRGRYSAFVFRTSGPFPGKCIQKIFTKKFVGTCIYEGIRIYLYYEGIRKTKATQMTDRLIPKPTEAELEILQVLWQYGPCPVRLVNEKLSEGREVGYTTTLKLMQIMVEKGLARRNTENRIHIYEAAVSEADTQRQLLDKFVDSTFRGSAMKLVMQALGQHRASEEELAEIKALIQRMEKK